MIEAAERLAAVVRQLRASGINCSVSYFRDCHGGFEMKLRDDETGFGAEAKFGKRQLVEPSTWLVETALRLYPGSDFALARVQ